MESSTPAALLASTVRGEDAHRPRAPRSGRALAGRFEPKDPLIFGIIHRAVASQTLPRRGLAGGVEGTAGLFSMARKSRLGLESRIASIRKRGGVFQCV